MLWKSRTLLLWLIVMGSLLVSVWTVTAQPLAYRGVLDLSAWDLRVDGMVRLDGEWEIYAEQLLEVAELPGQTTPAYAVVPHTWDDDRRYATYRLYVQTVLPAGTALGLYLPLAASSAYAVYVDDVLVGTSGQVGATAQEEQAVYQVKSVSFGIPASDFAIVLHVSNHFYARGGFWNTIRLGTSGDIADLHGNELSRHTFILGALFTTGLLFLVLFCFRRELRYALYFSLLCFSFMLAADMNNQFVLVRLFPSLPASVVVFLWYSSILWVLYSLSLYIYTVFPVRLPTVLIWMYHGFVALVQLAYLVTPTIIYTEFGLVGNFIELFNLVAVLVLALLGLRAGHRLAWMNVLSLVILVTAAVVLVLEAVFVLPRGLRGLSVIGIFVFAVIQVVIQADRMRLFHEEKTAAEVAFLQAQIKPHFLYNALNAVLALLRHDVVQGRGLLVEFCQYLRHSVDFSSEGSHQLVRLQKEIEHAQAYLAVQRIRFDDRLKVYFHVPENLSLVVPAFTLQPVVENAVVHGVLPKPGGGSVTVAMSVEGKWLACSVHDTGVGMTSKLAAQALSPYSDGRVGLANVDRRLREFCGRGLTIHSSLGEGTTVAWKVPVRVRRMHSDAVGDTNRR